MKPHTGKTIKEQRFVNKAVRKRRDKYRRRKDPMPIIPPMPPFLLKLHQERREP
jgi:hypothetical protein